MQNYWTYCSYQPITVGTAGTLRRLVLAACVLLGVMGCSSISMLHSVAPRLAYSNVDDYFDLDSTQAEQTKAAIARAFAWHSSTQAAAQAQWLRNNATLLAKPISPEQAMMVYQEGMRQRSVLVDYLTPDTAKFLSNLKPEQLQVQRKENEAGNLKWRKKWLDAPAKAVENERFKGALTWAERVYGSFDNGQQDRLRQLVNASPWNAAQAYQVKLARQALVSKALSEIVGNKTLSQAQIITKLQQLNTQLLPQNMSEHSAFILQTEQNVSKLVSQISQLTTPEQRQQGVKQVREWAAAVEALQVK